MAKMGISQEQIEAERVIIEKKDGNITIENPSVTKIDMQGQQNFQISGEIKEQTGEENEEAELAGDIKTVIEKTGCSIDEAAIELEKCNGDIAQAIINLTK